jgi:predicted nuclease of predicted toxin-antitoxin system
VDVGVGNKCEQFLNEVGHDIVCVRKVNSRATDEELLEIAVREQRIVLTMDKDFGELVYNSGKNHKGVLLLRLEDQTGKEKTRVLSEILEFHSENLEGHFSVYKKGRLRIRK